jgi:hypothetical protein
MALILFTLMDSILKTGLSNTAMFSKLRDVQVNNVPICRVQLGDSRNAPQVFYFSASPLGHRIAPNALSA